MENNKNNMLGDNSKFQFAIDRGGTFTDVFARCPGGKIRVLKLLSEDPQHYSDAPIEGNILRESEALKRYEVNQFKKQIKILATLIPDFLIRIPPSKLDILYNFVGVFLFADISGFTPLCEKYTKIGIHGIDRLTATLNAFVGAIVEMIYFYGGDVMKFSGDALLASWKAEPDDCIYQVMHRVIVCALLIQQTLGQFETEVNVLLKVKLAISCGNVNFRVIGNTDIKYYVVLGDAVNDVKTAEHVSVSGDVVIAPTAWGHLSEDSYEVTYGEGGHVKVWRCLYKPNEILKKEEYERMEEVAKELCEKHIIHRQRLHEQRLPDSEIVENFVRSLPRRESIGIAVQKWLASDLKKFVIKPVQDQIEGRQPLEYLTELREITIQFVNVIIDVHSPASRATLIVDTAYQIICQIVTKLLGVVNKVTLFDKDCVFLILFGLRGVKHELESQNALTSGFQILAQVSEIETIKSVSVGISNGLVYCGVVGHPLRKEYTVIGAPVNKAARLMCAFENKVTCDYRTFKNSKLSSYCFQMQSTVKLKGIEDAGHIFEYNENFDKPTCFQQAVLPIIGREDELELIHDVIERREGVEEYSGVCFYGKQKTGKTKILETAALQYKQEKHIVATIMLTAASLRPYFCVSLLYKQIFSRQSSLYASQGKIIALPPDLWDLKEIMQTSYTDSSSARTKVTSLFQAVCSDENGETTIILIDNVQFIDPQSLKVIATVLSQTELKLLCAGHFDESTWDVQWKLARTQLIKMIDLNPLGNDDIAPLCCQFLKTMGICKKLVILIIKTCEGRPGWIQSCLLRLVNNGRVEVKFITTSAEEVDLYILPNPKLLHSKYSTKSDSKAISGLIPVADMDSNFSENSDELTLAAISLDLFDSFPPYEQLVIKVGAVLGEIFSRSLLFVMLKYPSEQVLANAIRNLFEEEVLDCGSRYVSVGTLLSKKLCCYCYADEGDWNIIKQSCDLPKFAFCKLLHFKNKNLRLVAYDLLPANQRKELHLHITDVVENQNNSCPNCLRDDSTAIIRLLTFKQFMQYTNRDKEIRSLTEMADEDRPHNIKDIIRTNIRHNVKFDSSLSIGSKNRTKPLFNRKLWDPSTCFCLEILTRVYADLIHHSEQAEHLGKRIFYLMQYSVILFNLHEFNDSIPVLTEASELCMTDTTNINTAFSETIRKLYVSKIHMLLGEAHLRLGHIQTAKIHVSISLRQHNVPLMALKYKIPLMFLNRPRILYKTSYPFIAKRGNTTMQYDLGMCLTLLSTIFASEGKWELAKKAAERSISILRNSNANTQILCDAYTNAIELYNMFGDTHACERLERCIGINILKNYTDNVILELYAICKLISVLFKIRLMHGHISIAVRIGYRALDLILEIHAIYLQADLIPSMASALLMSKRIENAVCISKLLFNISKTADDTILIGYYAFCVELNLETSFILEPIEKCAKYAEQYFERQKNKDSLTDNENKILILLYVHFLRTGMWQEALKWKMLIKMEGNEFASFIMVSATYKYVEGMIMTLVWNIMVKKGLIGLEQKRLEIQLKNIQKLANKWTLFMPRYLHYMAYYKKIMNQNNSMRKYLKQSMRLARKQGNVLEECWIRQNENVWNGGVDLGNDVRDVHWTKAQSYTNDQWSTILYSLPYEITM
ncbi:hypothetical protein RI129_002068 [Pyrocoelia pectoralis]|uniref:Guanylate cyclase domain-containing protein n=1 Tax=Pyrocoelia pectoralis TaxID=417401 RepID=A0AAN7VL74_9COLE